MDLTLYEDNRLVVCVEVKERADQVQGLIRGLRRFAPTVDLAAPDRGNDPLRKAKYIVRHRPVYFSCVALGIRLEYWVDYSPKGCAFQLVDDLIPWS
jgi:hypothetical protein